MGRRSAKARSKRATGDGRSLLGRKAQRKKQVHAAREAMTAGRGNRHAGAHAIAQCGGAGWATGDGRIVSVPPFCAAGQCRKCRR